MAKRESVFEDKVVALFRSELEALNYDTRSIAENVSLIQTYFTVAKRNVPRRVRAVHEPVGFVVPDDVREGYRLLCEKFERGDDVSPHLHKPIRHADYHDPMLFDWGIHHFHLGEVEANGFVNRTGNVLYAIVKPDDVYSIVINPHQHWSEKEMLEIVEENWPDLLASYRLADDVTPEVDFDTAGVAEMRKHHINTILRLKSGHSYFGIGGGYQGDGSCSDAMLKALGLVKGLQRVEQRLEESVNGHNANHPECPPLKVTDFSDVFRDGDEVKARTADGAYTTTLFSLPPLKTYLGK